MEMKIGRTIQSSFSKNKSYRMGAGTLSAKSGGTNRDSFTISPGTIIFSKQHLQLMEFGRSIIGTATTPGSARIGGNPINLNDFPTLNSIRDIIIMNSIGKAFN